MSCTPPSSDNPTASSVAPAPASAPSSDDACSTPVQQAICTDPEIKELDERLTETFHRALEAAENPSAAQDEQQRWTAELDRCGTEPDVGRCVLQAYQTRLIELQIPTLPAPPVISYQCDDPTTPLTARFYPDADPSAMVLTWGEDSAILIQQPAASGIRYSRAGAEYREHQGEVTVDFNANTLSCTPQ